MNGEIVSIAFVALTACFPSHNRGFSNRLRYQVRHTAAAYVLIEHPAGGHCQWEYSHRPRPMGVSSTTLRINPRTFVNETVNRETETNYLTAETRAIMRGMKTATPTSTAVRAESITAAAAVSLA